jgi:hypothetical protein
LGPNNAIPSIPETISLMWLDFMLLVVMGFSILFDPDNRVLERSKIIMR